MDGKDGFGTGRLVARGAGLADAPALAALMSAPISGRLAFWPYPLSESDARSLLAEAVEAAREGSAYPFVIVETQSGSVVGWLKISRRPGPVPACDLTYWIGEAFHRRGYAAEIAGGAIEHAFRALGVDQVFAGAQLSNAASFSVMARSGMTFSHHEDVWVPTRQGSEPCEFWSVTRKDWQVASP